MSLLLWFPLLHRPGSSRMSGSLGLTRSVCGNSLIESRIPKRIARTPKHLRPGLVQTLLRLLESCWPDILNLGCTIPWCRPLPAVTVGYTLNCGFDISYHLLPLGNMCSLTCSSVCTLHSSMIGFVLSYSMNSFILAGNSSIFSTRMARIPNALASDTKLGLVMRVCACRFW